MKSPIVYSAVVHNVLMTAVNSVFLIYHLLINYAATAIDRPQVFDHMTLCFLKLFRSINIWAVFYDRHYSANSCLTPVCSLHGLAVTTVEALGSTKTRLHQIQVNSCINCFFSVADKHGFHCGRPVNNEGSHTHGEPYRMETIGKGKILPYSLLSIGPGADPGVQAISLQVTFFVIPLAAITFRQACDHLPS